jgi:hypothetical protein
LGVDCCDIIGAAHIAASAGAEGVVPTTRWSLYIEITKESTSTSSKKKSYFRVDKKTTS